MLSERRGKYKEFTMGIIGRIRYFFTMLLHSKGYTGKINFDLDRKTLTFIVSDSASHNSSYTDLMNRIVHLRHLQ